MLDDRFKWKVSTYLCLLFRFLPSFFLLQIMYAYLVCQAREMEKRKEGRPSEVTTALRRSVRDNGYVKESRCRAICWYS